MNLTQIKIKKSLINKILQDFQEKNHILVVEQAKAKELIEYAIAKFIIESNKQHGK